MGVCCEPRSTECKVDSKTIKPNPVDLNKETFGQSIQELKDNTVDDSLLNESELSPQIGHKDQHPVFTKEGLIKFYDLLNKEFRLKSKAAKETPQRSGVQC